MRHLRLFSVALLLSFAITGCHHRQQRAVPPPQAQAPIVTTLPPVPPLTFPNVELPKPKPATPVAQPTPPPPQKTEPVKKVHHHYIRHKAPPEKSVAATEHPESGTTAGASSDAKAQGSTTTATAALGKLSADDAAADPHENVQTQRLIERTEARLKKLSKTQRARYKDAVTQVTSFLSQARQAWSMNDVVGAETLANKAKILLDEMSSNTLPVP